VCARGDCTACGVNGVSSAPSPPAEAERCIPDDDDALVDRAAADVADELAEADIAAVGVVTAAGVTGPAVPNRPDDVDSSDNDNDDEGDGTGAGAAALSKVVPAVVLAEADAANRFAAADADDSDDSEAEEEEDRDEA
jgi:hypothetical protein